MHGVLYLYLSVCECVTVRVLVGLSLFHYGEIMQRLLDKTREYLTAGSVVTFA